MRTLRQKANFLAIALLLAAVLFLCQFFGLSFDVFNAGFEVNRYAGGTTARAAAFAPETGAPHIAIVGDPALIPAVVDGCVYMQRSYAVYPSLSAATPELTELLVLAPDADIRGELPLLLEYSRLGVPIVFSALPDTELIEESGELRTLLGVREVLSERSKVEATKLFGGFLLGGERIYEELTPEAPHVALLAGYEVYMVGVLDMEAADQYGNVDDVPLLWRSGAGGSQAVVVNGGYLSESRGVGFFTAIVGEIEGVALYPVVNAQTVQVQNFPYLSTENYERMLEWYSQSSSQVLTNTLLPRVISIISRDGNCLSAMFSNCLDYSATGGSRDTELLLIALRQIVRQQGELGLSGYERSGAYSMEKLRLDVELLAQTASGYTVVSFAPNGMAEEQYAPLLTEGGLLEDIRTLSQPRRADGDIERFAFYNDSVVQIPTTHDGFDYAEADDLALLSVETALAASNVSVDMTRAVYPEDDGDDWAMLDIGWSETMDTAWKRFGDFDRLTVAEAGERARTFLNVRYSVTETEGGLAVALENFEGSAWFMLRTGEQKIAHIRGGAFTELEEGAYLIEAESESMEIELEPGQSIGFKDGGWAR